MRWIVHRSTIDGSTTVPGDKSIAHRSLMFAALADGRSEIGYLPAGQDVQSTARVLRGLGVSIEQHDTTTVVVSDGRLQAPTEPLDCGNSGTTMRLMTGILAGQPFASELVGDESLSRRPMRRVVDPLALMGAHIETTDGHAPLRIRGGGLAASPTICRSRAHRSSRRSCWPDCLPAGEPRRARASISAAHAIIRSACCPRSGSTLTWSRVRTAGRRRSRVVRAPAAGARRAG